mmetsp:Transcript_26912/g.43264  ORF Transcript_26912/g.43264 Transcript_26912/m.43264 type:complete len:464 (+) Transcript_26912:135-1526(+)
METTNNNNKKKRSRESSSSPLPTKEGELQRPSKALRLNCSAGVNGKQTKGIKDQIKRNVLSSKNLSTLQAGAASVLLQILRKAATLLRQNGRRSLELDVRDRPDIVKEDANKGVCEVLEAIGWLKVGLSDPQKFLLHPNARIRIDINRVISMISKLPGSAQASSSTEKTPSLSNLVTVAFDSTTSPKSSEVAGYVEAAGDNFASKIRVALSEAKKSNSRDLYRKMLKAIQGILKKIAKGDSRARRIRCNGFIAKKFIISPTGGEILVKRIGFEKKKKSNGKKVEYWYELGDIQPVELETTRNLLEQEIIVGLADKKETPPPENKRVMCKCGFYGSTDTEGMCSICFKKAYQLSGTKSNTDSNKVVGGAGEWKMKFNRARLKIHAAYMLRKGSKRKKQQNKNRCFFCNRKVGILGFECRCMFTFCDKHRFPDAHNCKFDYKQQHKNKLKKDNQALSREKISKID